MWRLYHKLFGWDYVLWKNVTTSGVSRVRVDGRGICFYWLYSGAHCYTVIDNAHEVLWLTCDSDKYLNIKR